MRPSTKNINPIKVGAHNDVINIPTQAKCSAISSPK